MKKDKIITKILIFIFLSCSVLSCVTSDKNLAQNFSVIEASELSFDWEELADGIKISTLSYKTYPLKIFAVKIDLTNEKLKIFTTENMLFTNGKVKRESTLNFAKRNNLTLACNASFFRVKSMLLSQNAEPCGLHIHKGKVLHSAEYGCPSICFFYDNSAEILYSDIPATSNIPPKADFAISGYKMIVKNGKAVLNNIGNVEDSRTCIGLTEDGKTLILFFAEGENKLQSRGITFDQAAFFMLKLGARNAFHLDGGGSSSLIVKSKNKHIILVPSTSFSSPRPVATNLGFLIE